MTWVLGGGLGNVGRESWETDQCFQMGRPFEHWQLSLSKTLSLTVVYLSWHANSRRRRSTFICESVFSLQGSYLVDPASSHMLVSKIKPCMSKYKLLIL